MQVLMEDGRAQNACQRGERSAFNGVSTPAGDGGRGHLRPGRAGIAGIAGVSPVQVVKRTAIPMLVAAIVNSLFVIMG